MCQERYKPITSVEKDVQEEWVEKQRAYGKWPKGMNYWIQIKLKLQKLIVLTLTLKKR